MTPDGDEVAFRMRGLAILVAGLGYIGAALGRHLGDRVGEKVVALDNYFSTPKQALLAQGLEVIEGDIADPRAVAAAFEAIGNGASVYFLAAQPSAAIAAREPELTERSNLTGARVLLEAARTHGTRVVFGGSFRVYGDDLTGRSVDEYVPYGRVGDLSHLSKIYVEQLARMLGVRFASVRLGVTYGLSPIMKDTPELMTVPNLFCLRAVRGLPLEVKEDRPMAFVHVDDAAAALVAADALLESAHEPYTIVNAAPEVATIGQVARTVQKLMRQRGGDAEIVGAAASEASFKVSTRLSGWAPRHTLESSLGEVLDYVATSDPT
jgi:nucleoside-diphosphate-sugar epimerase